MDDIPHDPQPDPGARRRRPDRFGRFVVTEWLGMGGMGTVYRGTDPQFDRPVALKVMSGAISHVPEFRERFRREATALARLTSPHVITIYDHGEQDGVLWLATQFVSGGELGELIGERGPLPPSLALGVAAQVADALAASHAIGVLHRDVKPGNVLLRDADATRLHAYLCDFGIADTGAEGLTATGGVAGTWEYLAPERAAGAPASAATDIYALGCLLWTCLVGRPPFTGSDVAVMLGHSEGPVPQLLETSPLHHELNRLLAGCLAKQPGDRISSVTQVRDALDELRARFDATDAVAPTLPAPPSHPSTPGRRRGGRRRKAVVAVATTLVLVGGGIAVWLGLRGSGDNPDNGGRLPPATAGVTADVDGDGQGDLVVSDWTGDPSRVVALPSSGDAFGEVEEVGEGELGNLLGDVDGDGTSEVVTAPGTETVTIQHPGEDARELDVGSPDGDDFFDHALADITGDGRDDLVAISSASTNQATTAIWMAPSTGEEFGDWVELASTEHDHRFLLPGDFDGDGDEDLALMASDQATIELMVADGTTLTSQGPKATNLVFFNPAVGDFDGDGTDEIAFISSAPKTESISLARWREGRWNDEIWWEGDDAFHLSAPNPATGVADADGDGSDDLIRFSDGEGPTERTVWLFRSTGEGFADGEEWARYTCECDDYFDPVATHPPA